MHARRSRVAVLLAACALTFTATTTWVGEASAQEDAGSHFDRGLTFFKDGDFVAAMVEFKKAYELDPNWQVLYNLGQTSRELRDYAAALTWFEQYLQQGGSDIEPDRKKKVEAWASELRDKVARVTLTCKVEGAEVTVDDIPVGKTPLPKAVIMNAGRRKVSVAKGGYAPFTQFVDVAGTEQKTLEINLVALTADSGPKKKVIPVEHTPWPWVGLALTGVLGIATGVTGGFALARKSDFDDTLDRLGATTDEIESARKTAKTFALAADVLTGFTVAAGALTVIAFAVDYSRSPKEVVAQSEPAEPSPELHVSVGLGYVGVDGSF
ncbi:MAG: PEGA domain-containing protein [Polyangiaceae bacterium]